MRNLLSSVALALLVLGAASARAAEEAPKVALETNKGTIVLELFADKAPVTVKNFLEYVDAKHYNGTIFHRVIPGFMVQGGGYNKHLMEKPTRGPIKNEAANGLSNERGTLAMARTSAVDSATAQFFINVANNDFLDHKGPHQFGYAVFGRVAEGMGVVDAAVAAPRQCTSDGKVPCKGDLPPGMQDVPVEAVVIVKAYRLK